MSFFWYTKNIKDAREGWFRSTLIAANFHYIMIYVMNKRDFSEEFTIARRSTSFCCDILLIISQSKKKHRANAPKARSFF